MWSSTILVWQPETNAWIAPPPSLLHDLGAGADKLIITKEIYPRCYSIVVVIGSLGAVLFLYRAARRQAFLMLSVYGEEENRPYQRSWGEIRVTFWALLIVLLGALFLFLV